MKAFARLCAATTVVVLLATGCNSKSDSPKAQPSPSVQSLEQIVKQHTRKISATNQLFVPKGDVYNLAGVSDHYAAAWQPYLQGTPLQADVNLGVAAAATKEQAEQLCPGIMRTGFDLDNPNQPIAYCFGKRPAGPNSKAQTSGGMVIPDTAYRRALIAQTTKFGSKEAQLAASITVASFYTHHLLMSWLTNYGWLSGDQRLEQFRHCMVGVVLRSVVPLALFNETQLQRAFAFVGRFMPIGNEDIKSRIQMLQLGMGAGSLSTCLLKGGVETGTAPVSASAASGTFTPTCRYFVLRT